jgi:hypothetical protein
MTSAADRMTATDLEAGMRPRAWSVMRQYTVRVHGLSCVGTSSPHMESIQVQQDQAEVECHRTAGVPSAGVIGSGNERNPERVGVPSGTDQKNKKIKNRGGSSSGQVFGFRDVSGLSGVQV